MRDYTLAQCPRETPWGAAQSREEVFPGCWSIGTSSHGGYYVAPEVLAQMPDCLSRNTWAGPGWFEEDCDWALVVCAFPQHFSEYARLCAVDSVRGREDKTAWQDFSQTAEGMRLLAEVEAYRKANGDKYERGSMGTNGGAWSVSASRLDGGRRIRFRIEDPWKLKSPFTMAELEAVAEPGSIVDTTEPAAEPATV